MMTDIDVFRMATKAFIENEKGEILILKESEEYDEGTNADKWQIPGGRMEPGEKYKEALKREIREETNLEIEVESPVAIGEWRPEIKGEKWQIVAVFFYCEKKGGDVELSHEHMDFRWIDPEDPPEFKFIGNVPEKIEKFAERSDSELPKLIRDRIPEIIRENDQKPVTRKVSDEEAERFLRQKVVEEAREFEEGGEVEELADLFAVMEEYMERNGIDISELREIEDKKSDEGGGFKQNIILEAIEE